MASENESTPVRAKQPQAIIIKKEPDAVMRPSTSAAAAAAMAKLSPTVASAGKKPGTATKAGLLKLPSFAKPRDLSLGGLVNPTNKKVYTPNLNVVRNKNTTVRTSKDTTRGGRAERSRGRGGARGRGANSNYVQTAGLFSEGAGATYMRKSLLGKAGTNEKSESCVMRRPIITNSIQKIDIKKDEEYVREILEESDDDYKDENVKLDEMPVKLSDGKFAEFPRMKLEHVGCEEDYDAIMNGNVTNTAASLRVKMEKEGRMAAEGNSSIPPEKVHVQSLEQLFDSTTPLTFVMQLPDTLPFECDDDENSDDDIPKGLRTSKPMPKTHSLKEMDEGKVGKIVRYKSGRVKLILGESHFNLEFGMEPGCVQDLMSINSNSEERSANMINLGPINGKVTVVPDWDHMLHQHDLKVSRES